MSSKAKKIAAAATAVALSASLLLGGTYAWQSVNQVALNEASDVINPGGRLHDDFDGSNKDIYVENFASEDIFARVRLEEYMEVVMNYNTAAERVETIAGSKTLKEGATADADGSTEKDQFDYLYDIHYFDAENATDKFWNWATGGSTTYMPTFNKNKDSLQADVNGVYVDAVGGISNRDGTQYGEYVDYSLPENAEKPAKAVYDADANNIEDEGVTEVEETHEAKSTLGATLMSMQEWIDAGSNPGNYWVYDTDGWVYWADAIEPDTATGLLLDGISLDGVMDDTWYYAINVVAQFITADDLGAEDGTGFYDTNMGKVPSPDALALLEAIGVDTEAAKDMQPQTIELPLDTDYTANVSGDYDDSYIIGIAAGHESGEYEDEDGTIETWTADVSTISVAGNAEDESVSLTAGEDYTYTYDAESNSGVLTLLNHGYNEYHITDSTGNIGGYIYIGEAPSDEPVEDEESYHLHVRVIEIDNVNHIVPNTPYSVLVEVSENDNGYGPETAGDTSVSLTVSAKDHNGNDVPLTEGVDYSLSWQDGYTDGAFDSDNKVLANIMVLNEDLMGDWLTVYAETNTGSAFGENTTIINENYTDLDVAFYDSEGNEANVNYMEPGTYDVVISFEVEGEQVVLYSSNTELYPVSDKIVSMVTDDPAIVNYFDGGTYLNDAGQLVLAEDSCINDNGALGFTVYDLILNLSDGTQLRTYAYGQNDWVHQKGYSPLILGDIVALRKSAAGEQLEVLYYNNEPVDLTDATITLSGNNSNKTSYAIENGNLIVYIGADETATEITIDAKNENGSGQRSYSIDSEYTESPIIYAMSDESDVSELSKGQTYTLKLTSTDSHTVNDEIKWSVAAVEGKTLNEGTTVTGNMLTVAADESNTAVIISATTKAGYTANSEYYVYQETTE